VDFFHRLGINTARDLTLLNKDEAVAKGIVGRRLGYVRQCLSAFGLTFRDEGKKIPVLTVVPADVGSTEVVKLQEDKPTVRKPNRMESSRLEELTYSQVYSILVGRASTISGERILRGSIPILWTEFQVGGGGAAELLAKLETEKYIARRDGWRVIILLHDSVDRNDAILGQKAPPAEIKPEPRKLQPISGDGKKSSRHVVLDTAISWIERQLPPLREMLGEANNRLEKLEGSLALLKLARDNHNEAVVNVDEVLKQVEAATMEFFALLRQGGQQ
jgi:hypothetical protein